MPSRTCWTFCDNRRSSRMRFRDSKVKVENVAAEYVAAGIEIEQSLEISNLIYKMTSLSTDAFTHYQDQAQMSMQCIAWIQQMSSECQRSLKNPQFIVDGVRSRSGDVAQSAACGDCWFLGGIATMSPCPGPVTLLRVHRETCQQGRNLYHKRQSIRKQSDARP
ncbi:hypothetical protein JB92DRAFT_3043794 [Gautieria morchelliformis]|nr:hypothetical protein JB92DRAFT_3043794 [Gautieria morchelliformis]